MIIWGSPFKMEDNTPVDLITKPKAAAPNWSYRDISSWADVYPTCQNKPTSHQSPINIDTSQVVFAEMPIFVLSKFDCVNNITMELVNNGYTAKLVVNGDPIDISGGGLPYTFKLANLHFHWGDTSAIGSEHQIDHRVYPMEMHLVNYNLLYSDVKFACCQPDGLAVLAFFFEIQSSPNPAYNEIVKKLPEIAMPGSRIKLTPFPLESLLPSDLQHFYRYEGSLTTPSCDETVKWTVFETPVQISEDQISAFRSLKSLDIDPETKINLPLVNNTRPLQSLNDRVIYTSFTVTKTERKKSFFKRCPCLRGSN